MLHLASLLILFLPFYIGDFPITDAKSAAAAAAGAGSSALDAPTRSGAYCRQPGHRCNNPAGGICQRPTKNSELVCACPSSHAMVASGAEDGGHICQIKLMNMHCNRDNDFACQMVKESVCNPTGGHCVCPMGYVFVPHSHQCKRRYTGNHAYCEYCRKEFGTCFIEDDMRRSPGPEITEKGSPLRLSCACPKGKGVPRPSVSGWQAPVCSTRLSDIEEECNGRDLLCRSKRAECRKPRNAEVDWRRCLCPPRHIPVYQKWLQYYECFEEMDSNSPGCEKCSRSKPYGICYSTNNGTSGTGCSCPKRMSTSKGAEHFCTKHHVTITCGLGKMVVTFDPDYPDAPYDKLEERLQLDRAAVYVEGDSPDSLCQLRANRRLYQVTLDTEKEGPCGKRTVRATPLDNKRYRYEAKLKVLYNKDFFTYPDINLDIYCTTDNHPLRHKGGHALESKRRSNRRDQPVVSRVELAFRVLNGNGALVTEVEEENPIRLDLTLDDPRGQYTGLMVQECSVTNRSRVRFDEKATSAPKRIIKCGGLKKFDVDRLPVGAEGFTMGFTQNGGSQNHQRTRLFPAFRIGRTPSIYFQCTVRVCTAAESRFCDESNCSDKNKRSPDDGLKVVEKEVQIVVIKKQSSRKEITVSSYCTYSVCLTTGQIVVIILVLLTIIALTCGLVIVVYRRKMLYNAHRLTQLQLDEDNCNQMDQDFKPSLSVSAGVHRSNRGSVTLSAHSPVGNHTSTCEGRGVCPSSYSSHLTIDRSTSSALLSNNRPDVCTCDRTIHRSYSVTSSQV